MKIFHVLALLCLTKASAQTIFSYTFENATVSGVVELNGIVYVVSNEGHVPAFATFERSYLSQFTLDGTPFNKILIGDNRTKSGSLAVLCGECLRRRYPLLGRNQSLWAEPGASMGHRKSWVWQRFQLPAGCYDGWICRLAVWDWWLRGGEWRHWCGPMAKQ